MALSCNKMAPEISACTCALFSCFFCFQNKIFMPFMSGGSKCCKMSVKNKADNLFLKRFFFLLILDYGIFLDWGVGSRFQE